MSTASTSDAKVFLSETTGVVLPDYALQIKNEATPQQISKPLIWMSLSDNTPKHPALWNNNLRTFSQIF